MQPRIVVAGVVQDERDRILLVKEILEDGNEWWIFPGGGVEFGETLEEALIRELKEELNLEAKNPEFLFFKEVISKPHNYHSIVFFFRVKIGKSSVITSPEIIEWNFFEKNELKSLKLVESARWVLERLGYL